MMQSALQVIDLPADKVTRTDATIVASHNVQHINVPEGGNR
jgi:hypothetical protein